MSSPNAQTRSYVVGTAGHIDHGKSALVQALTGTDPDRLAEEKARGMTIDLGFAHFTSPAGRSVSVVDVPGHERFIKNMLAGVGGIDAALLVVAADEGPMPQTREHLAILTLLEVCAGVVALTKRDLVDDDWLGYVAEELREELAGTPLAGAPIVPVSARTGEGLDALRAAIDAVLLGLPERAADGVPRLPVDRVFTMAGFGTVVTGTLGGGPLAVGDEAEIAPTGLRTRIRGVQSHGRRGERAQPGARVALNLQGLAVEQVRRGHVVTTPGGLKPSRLLDAHVSVLADAPGPLKHNAEVDLFLGSAEIPARVTLLDADAIEPGDEGWVQLRLRGPAAALRGDRFILRRPSPSATVGGGEIVDPTPVRHRRFSDATIEELERRRAGTPEELLLAALGHDLVELAALLAALPGLERAETERLLNDLALAGRVRRVGSDGYLAADAWSALRTRLEAELAAFHAAHPLRRGMPREELRARLALPGGPRRLDALLALAVEDAVLVDEGRSVRLPTHTIRLGSEQRAAADRFLAAVDAAPFAPPPPAELGLSPETVAALVELGEAIETAPEIVLTPAALATVRERVLALLEGDGKITLARYRDAVGTSRKYAQATLEYLDAIGVTRRVGDERVRGRAAAAVEEGVHA